MGRSATSLGSSPAWLCGSSAHLGPGELNIVRVRMPNYSLNWTARSSTIQSGPAGAGGLLASSLPGMDCLSMLQLTHQKVAQPKPGVFDVKSAKAWPLKVRGEESRGRSDPSWNSSSAGLCRISAHLVQCGPDKRRCPWTQIWVKACMPDYSLNWTAKSSAIQEWQRCQCCSSSTRRWPCRIRGPFGLKSAIEH